MKISIRTAFYFLSLILSFRNELAFSEIKHDYPRTMAIAIGVPAKYDDPALQRNLSNADILILGFWSHWKENEQKSARDVVKAIKRLNPNILVGQYTILNEARASDNPDKTNKDIAIKLDQEKWWLKGPTGNRVQYTDKYETWNVNITKSTKADKDNKRYPEWLAERNYRVFFQKVPEFDFWFMDITVSESPVAIADWNNNGIPQISSLPHVSKVYREGHVAYWNAIRALQPNTLLIGNAIDLSSNEYNGQLNGAVFEAAMGLNWSIYERQGWEAMRKRYYQFMQNTRPPKLVGFDVHGLANDYRKMRFGLTTCLLNDGYFSYTDIKAEYSTMLWFDEFGIELGNPIDAPPEQPWRNGVYKRQFEKGIVLVNPGRAEVTIQLERPYTKIQGTQDPVTNSGKIINAVNIKPADGVILLNPDPPSSPTLEIAK